MGNCYEFVTIIMSRYSQCFAVISKKWMRISVASANSNSKPTSKVQKVHLKSNQAHIGHDCLCAHKME